MTKRKGSGAPLESSRLETARSQALLSRFRLSVIVVRTHKHVVGISPKTAFLSDRRRKTEGREFVLYLAGRGLILEFAHLEIHFRWSAGVLFSRNHRVDIGLARRCERWSWAEFTRN